MFDTLLSGLFLALIGIVDAASPSASGVPWPPLPSLEPYSAANGKAYFEPVSISSGLTSNTTNITSSRLTFNAVGDIFTSQLYDYQAIE